MAEYIDKGRIIDFFKDTYGGGNEENTCIWYQDVIRDIDETPADDVAPVVHGKWIIKKMDNFRKYEVTCSNCGWVSMENYDSYNDPSEFNYCPNCGAKMD